MTFLLPGVPPPRLDARLSGRSGAADSPGLAVTRPLISERNRSAHRRGSATANRPLHAHLFLGKVEHRLRLARERLTSGMGEFNRKVVGLALGPGRFAITTARRRMHPQR